MSRPFGRLFKFKQLRAPFGLRSALCWATVAAGERAFRMPSEGMGPVESAMNATPESRPARGECARRTAARHGLRCSIVSRRLHARGR